MSEHGWQAVQAREALRRGYLSERDACAICLGVGFTASDTRALLGIDTETVNEELLHEARERYALGEITIGDFETIAAQLVT